LIIISMKANRYSLSMLDNIKPVGFESTGFRIERINSKIHFLGFLIGFIAHLD
jgi:hypothetical protein